MAEYWRNYSTPLKLFLGLVFLTVAMSGYYYKKNSQTYEQFTAPPFQLEKIDGSFFSFPGEIDKQITLVHFWASWCEPCIDELPELFGFIDGLEFRNVRLIAISLDQKWEDAKTILNSYPYQESSKIIQVIDPELKVAHQFGAFQYPETIVLYGSDKILTKWVGPQKWKDPYYLKLLTYFLEHPPAE